MERDDWHLLKRYYRGECTPEEITRVPAEFRTPAGERVFAEILSAADLRHRLPTSVDGATAYEHFLRRRATSGVIGTRDARRGTPLPQRLMLWLVAFILIGTGGSALVWRKQALQQNFQPNMYRVVATGTTSRTVTLHDGSRVTLAPSAALTVSRHYGRVDRTVSLQGRGYFEVSQTSGAPFIVNAGGVTVHVLGTQFGVDARTPSVGIRIAVTSGKISLAPLRGTHTPRVMSPVTLSAGMLAMVTDSSITTATSTVSTDAQQWGDGLLVFHNSRAQEVLAVLSAWYGYRFRLTDPAISEKRLTIGISTESGTSALSTFRQSLNVDLTFVAGDTIVVRPRTAGSSSHSRAHDRDSDIGTLSHEVGR